MGNKPAPSIICNSDTKTPLLYIQELKRKHGIDYDVHASYRFIE